MADPGWKEDKWISAIEPRPGNASIGTTSLLFVDSAGRSKINGRAGSGNDFFGAFAPGLRPEPWPMGMAPLRAGWLEADLPDALRPNGSAQKDRSYLRVRVRPDPPRP